MTIHDVYRPMSRYFRSRRMEHFQTLFHITSRTRILDDGGTEFNWELISVRPSLRILNLRFAKIPVSQFHYVVGNGLQIPFRDRAFDIVFSNSVIEHVGDEANIQAFADEIRRVGKGFYVQTPNRDFLIEPHYITLFLHFLPKTWQKSLLRFCSLWGWITRPSREEAAAFVDSIHLLTFAKMQLLFPDAEILRERVLLFTKSLIAVKLPAPPDAPFGVGAEANAMLIRNQDGIRRSVSTEIVR